MSQTSRTLMEQIRKCFRPSLSRLCDPSSIGQVSSICCWSLRWVASYDASFSPRRQTRIGTCLCHFEGSKESRVIIYMFRPHECCFLRSRGCFLWSLPCTRRGSQEDFVPRTEKRKGRKVSLTVDSISSALFFSSLLVVLRFRKKHFKIPGLNVPMHG